MNWGEICLKLFAFVVTFLTKFFRSVRAEASGGFIGGIVAIGVGLYVAAAVIPDAIVDITNTTLWAGAPPAVITLGTTVLGIVAVVALVLLFLKDRIHKG